MSWKVAVTGASGQIGSALCRELVRQGYEVNALVRNDCPAINGLPLKVCSGNVLDKDSLIRLMDECNVVIHTAANIELGYRFSQSLYNVNVTGAKNVLEAAEECGVQKVLLFSSVHVFDQKPSERILDESRNFVGNNSVFYDQTKREAHLLGMSAAEAGQDVVILCPTSVVGPPDFKYSHIGKAVYDIYTGRVPAVVKGGFDFVDLRDVVQASIKAIHHGRSGEAYILGGKYHTVKEFADLIYAHKELERRMTELPASVAIAALPVVKFWTRLTGKDPFYDKVYIDILQDGNRYISSEKAKKELRFSPRPLSETLEDLIAWFIEQGKLQAR